MVHRPSVLLSLLALLLIAAGCGSGLEPPPDEAPPNGTPPNGDDPPGNGPPGDDPPPDTCPDALADRLVVIPVPDAGAGTRHLADAVEGGGAVAGWQSGGGVVLLRLTDAGQPVGEPVSLDGHGLYGLAATPDGPAALVARGSDALYLMGVDWDGESRFEERLLGEVDHDVTGNEWFGHLLRYGRLGWTGEHLAAYYTVTRLWPDGIAHYGDQLRLFAPDGSPASTRWTWGCSHSMEVRIAHNGTRLGPVCASDCYPSKGIHFDHRGAMLYPDEGGSNCAGGYGTTLGGLVPLADGFWVTYTATDDRASHDVGLSFVANDGQASDPIWLTETGADERHVKAAPYGEGFVVAFVDGAGEARIGLFDADGVAIGPFEALPDAALSTASDFFVFVGGDVGWVAAVDGGLALMRLEACP